MNTQIPLADDLQFSLTQTSCIRMCHYLICIFSNRILPHHGKMLEMCFLINNSDIFWPAGCIRLQKGC